MCPCHCDLRSIRGFAVVLVAGVPVDAFGRPLSCVIGTMGGYVVALAATVPG